MYILDQCFLKMICMMKTISSERVAIFSDIHLGIHQNSFQWHKIANDWTDWFVSQLKANDIDTVIFCGDFFHYRDSVAVSTISLAADILNKLRDYQLIMIPGNHDCYYKDSSEINSISILRSYPNVFVIEEPMTLKHNDKNLTFVPWGYGIAELPVSDIIFGHFEIKSFKMNTFKVCDSGIPMPEILKKSPLIISGHFHLRSERKLDIGTVLYVGNPYAMDFGDAAGMSKGMYILNLNDSSYEFIENTISPTFVKIKLSDLIQYNGISNQVRKMFAGNMVRLVVDKSLSSEDAEYLFTRLRSLSPASFDVEHDVQFDLLIGDMEADLSGVDVETALGAFIDMLDIDNKDQVLEYTINLYKRVS